MNKLQQALATAAIKETIKCILKAFVLRDLALR
jgi:hypothetical protein